MTSDQRKGSTYTLVPDPESIIEAGKDGKIRFTVIGKTFRKLRGFKSPIIADVYYVRGGGGSHSYDFPLGSDPEDSHRCEQLPNSLESSRSLSSVAYY